MFLSCLSSPEALFEPNTSSFFLMHTSYIYHSTISEAMRLVTDPADFLGTPYRFVSNFSLVNDTLNYLTPENSVIFIGSQKLNFSDSSYLPVSQQGPEPVPWPGELTEVCYFTLSSVCVHRKGNWKFFCKRLLTEYFSHHQIKIYVHTMCILPLFSS